MNWMILLLLGLACFQRVHAAHEVNPIVSLDQGKVRGYSDTTAKGKHVYVFRGLPYAKPPVGNLRFKDPEPADGWQNVRDGTRVYPECSQMDFIDYAQTRVVKYLGEEDCLTLTVYTPEVPNENIKIPVMFYIHGGGYFSGGGNSYEGTEILDGGVILVVINYRLGVLGFLSTEDDVIPGNFGLKDQTLAMKWVQKNIRRFGGDPDNVTIFGQSAGGGSTSTQVLIPSSKGLFSRAIVQSGGAICDWAVSKGHRDHALQVGALVGCFPSSEYGVRKSQRLLECLQRADAKELSLSIFKFKVSGFLPIVFVPRVDGKFIPEHPAALLRDGKHHMVDMMIGTTAHEGGFVTDGLFKYENERKKFDENFDLVAPVICGVMREEDPVGLSHKFFQKYIGGTNIEGKHEEVQKMINDRMFQICISQIAQYHARNVRPHGKHVYNYLFSHRLENPFVNPLHSDLKSDWVDHLDEIVLLFPFGQSSRNEADSRVRDHLVSLWTNFAKYGNPTPDDSLGFNWEPLNKELRSLDIQVNPSMKDDTRNEARNFVFSLGISEFEILKGSRSPHDEL